MAEVRECWGGWVQEHRGDVHALADRIQPLQDPLQGFWFQVNRELPGVILGFGLLDRLSVIRTGWKRGGKLTTGMRVGITRCGGMPGTDVPIRQRGLAGYCVVGGVSTMHREAF